MQNKEKSQANGNAHLLAPDYSACPCRSLRQSANVARIRVATEGEALAAKARSGVSARDTSRDRLLEALFLFTIDRPLWTVEQAADTLGVSITTAYRYFRSLAQFRLISAVSRASYMLGPAIIEMDRQIQICDPLLNAARGVMLGLIDYAADGSVVLLCRCFGNRVLCVHQVIGRGPQEPVSYERGRPMPLFRGATSQVILAHLPGRTLKALFESQGGTVRVAGLGDDFGVFKKSLAAIRRAGFCVTYSEVDAGRVGISAPVFDADRKILGSLSFVLPSAHAESALINRLVPLTKAGAREIELAMRNDLEVDQDRLTVLRE